MTSHQKTIAEAGSTQEVIKVRYTAKTRTLGGRRGGVSGSHDGRLDVKFSAPGAPGMLARGQRASLDDLDKARRFTANVREQEPSLLGGVKSSRPEKSGAITDDEAIAKNWREVNEWKGKNLGYGRRGWFRW